MQMRTRHASGLPGESQPLALPKFVSHLDVYLRKMHINSKEPLPVIHDYAIALVEEFLRQYHRPRVRYHDRRAFAYRKVRPPVGTAQFLIKYAGHPKRLRRLCLHRRDKIARPQRRADEMRKCPVL